MTSRARAWFQLVLAGTGLLACFAKNGAAQTWIFSDGFELGAVDGWGSTDEEILRTRIAGPPVSSAGVAALLGVLAGRSGFPIGTEGGTFLFATDCQSVVPGLVGDFNGWVPVAMNANGSLCWKEVSIATPEDSAYRFDFEGTEQPDGFARRYVYAEDGERSLVRSVGGHLERWLGLGPSVGLLPRELEIWLPESGAFDRILYLQDGQNLFDPDASFGGWSLQSALPAGVLAVGIHNTVERLDEYTPFPDDFSGSALGGRGDDYADLVHLVVRPFVESRYGAGSVRGVLGSTLGGLIALHIAQRFPGEYDFAGSMSGSLGWGSIGTHTETLLERAQAAGLGTTVIYLDSGGSGTCTDGDADGIQDDGADTDNFCVTLQMRNILQGVGYSLESDLFYLWDMGAPTNESAWSARVSTPLQVFAAL